MRKINLVTIVVLFVVTIISGLIYVFPDYLFLMFFTLKKHKDIIDTLSGIISAVSGLVATILTVYNLKYLDNTAMGKHRVSLKQDFPDKRYIERRNSFCKSLLRLLDDIDQETKWSAELYTPLDAEVEIFPAANSKRRITDLLKAIRSNQQTKIFLVLGDPGSGKSIALRQLCRDLLKEVTKTDKIPIYINLKEWLPEEPWTEENPPTYKELNNFVLQYLKERGDVWFESFLKDYYEDLVYSGRIFFILDSFDEIPAVMDSEESSWIITELSEIINKFIVGTHHSRGILASRFHRSPDKGKFRAETQLEIRPFTDQKIRDNIRKNFKNYKEIEVIIFRDHPTWLSILRNPFNSALVLKFLEENRRMPNNRMEVFESYIHKRLLECESRIKRFGLSINIVMEKTMEIAYLMYSEFDSGLEIDIEYLRKRLKAKSTEDVINILKYARIGRIKTSYVSKFSFVHRRFAEFFLTKKILKNDHQIPFQSIPTDTRWWDSMVLYCEIAPEEKATQVANFCWEEINKHVGSNLKTWKQINRISDEISVAENLYRKKQSDLNNTLVGRFAKNFYEPILPRFFTKMQRLVFSEKFGHLLTFTRTILNYYSDQKKVFLSPLFEIRSKLYKKSSAVFQKNQIRINLNPKEFTYTVNSLRFLIHAFHSRKECLKSFQNNLTDLIAFVIESNSNLVTSKIAAEAIGLTKSSSMNWLLELALSTKIDWIVENAFKACRHLSNIQKDLVSQFGNYFLNLSFIELFKRRKNLLFSFKLSNVFSGLSSSIKVKLWNSYTQILGCMLLIITNLITMFSGIEFVEMTTIILSLIILYSVFSKSYESFVNIASKMPILIPLFLLFKPVPLRFFLGIIAILNVNETIKLVYTFNLEFNFYLIIHIGLQIIGGILVFPWIDLYMVGKKANLSLKEKFMRRNNLKTKSRGQFQKYRENKDVYLKTIFLKKSYIALNHLLSYLSIVIPILLTAIVILSILYISGANLGRDSFDSVEKFIGNLLFSFLYYFILSLPFIFIIIWLIRTYSKIKKRLIIKRFLRKLEISNPMQRAHIAEDFYQYSVSGLHLEYVKELQKRHIKAIGVWPNNILPNKDNDKASVILAQLEEKWLGLEK